MNVALLDQGEGHQKEGGAPEAGELPYPRAGYVAFVLSLLMLVTVLSLVDRQLPNLLIMQLRSEFDVSNVQISFLQGGSFALVYCIAGPLLGGFVDRGNRRNVILVGAIGWSLATALVAFSETYWQLLICRMGVGIGEACLMPAGYSLIADYVRPERRGRALAIYFMSVSLGAGASFFIGGVALSIWPPEAILQLPLLGDMRFWRILFLAAGMAGLILCPILLAIREVPRRGVSGRSVAAARPANTREFLGYVGLNRKTFFYLFSGQILINLVAYAVMPWSITLLIVKFGMSSGGAAIGIGLGTLIGGPLGSFICGWVADRSLARGVPAARLRVSLLAWVVFTPMLALWPFAPNATIAMTMYGLGSMGLAIGSTSAPAAIQDVVPNHMRGRATVLYASLTLLFALGLGPTITAVLTDWVFGGDAGLAYAMAMTPVCAALFGVAVAILGLRPYEASRQHILRLEEQR